MTENAPLTEKPAAKMTPGEALVLLNRIEADLAAIRSAFASYGSQSWESLLADRCETARGYVNACRRVAIKAEKETSNGN